MSIIKERLKELREEKGLNQGQVADALKIPWSTYGNWEQGRREPSLDDVALLAKFFHATAGYLIGTEN